MQQNQFERNRDFEMDQYAKYMSGILGRAPTQGKNYTPNLVDPTSATISGALSGFGMGGQLYNQFAGGWRWGDLPTIQHKVTRWHQSPKGMATIVTHLYFRGSIWQ